MDRKFANNSPIYKNSTKRSHDLLRGQDDILRQGKANITRDIGVQPYFYFTFLAQALN